MKIKEDRCYKDRKGQIRGPLFFDKSTKTFRDRTYGYQWSDKGKILTSPLFDYRHLAKHDYDLVEYVRRKSKAMKRKLQ